MGYPILILLMHRSYIVSALSDRLREEREDKQATEVLRSRQRVTLRSTLLPCLCLPSEFLAGQGSSAGNTGELSEETHEGGWPGEARREAL